MITFKQFFYEKVDNFANTINKLKEQGFIIKDGKIGGDDVVLICPAHMGVERVKYNLIYRSSIWTTDGQPVSLSFPKFFNWGERSELVPEPTSLKNAIAKGKLDGSTLITSKHNGELIVRTRGTFDATQLDNGHEISVLKQRYPKAFNNKYINSEQYSVIYEWVSPINRIVLDYGPEPDIFLTAVIQHDGYKMLSQPQVDNIAKELGVMRPEEFKFSDIGTMIQSIKDLKDKEGICLYFGPDGQCIKKIKSTDYLTKHHFRSNLTPKTMIGMYLHYDLPSYEEFLNKIETDFDYENMVMSKPLVKKITDAKNQIDKLMADIEQEVAPLRNKERRDAAREIMNKYNKIGYTGLAFKVLDGKELMPKDYKNMLLDILKEE